jgi:hypothetical protein
LSESAFSTSPLSPVDNLPDLRQILAANVLLDEIDNRVAALRQRVALTAVSYSDVMDHTSKIRSVLYQTETLFEEKPRKNVPHGLRVPGPE